MLFKWGRRRFRNRSNKILFILLVCLIFSLIFRKKLGSTRISIRKDLPKRLYCILLNTHAKHEPFIQMSNQTWAKDCQKIGFVKYRKIHDPDNEINNHQLPYHVILWKHILDAIRQSFSDSDEISIDDGLIIVPAPSFVFRKHVFSLLQTSTNYSHLPLILIHEQQEGNAYLINGHALDLILNTKLIDSCLQQSYPSARETYLWKCIQQILQKKYQNIKCEKKKCFIQYQLYHLTLAHIKNGFCLQSSSTQCQTIPLLYPITMNDLITLEYFQNRLKPKSIPN